MGTPAFYFDGTTAFRHDVTVADDGQAAGGGGSGGGVRIIGADGADIGGVLYADLLWREEEGGLPIFGLKDMEGWRLGFLAPPPADMAARLPRKVTYGGVIDRVGLPAALGAFALVSVGAVALFSAMPQWLAPFVPYSWEQKMGEAIVGDFGGRLCHTDAGQAALDRLESKLDANGAELDVRVANIDMVNAVALPGGKIIIFQGLLDNAESSDEMAGVLAHEIGHVRRRHVMQSLLRQLGLSFLLGGVDGQAGGALNSLLSMAYGREAERDADTWSIARMAEAKIDPTDTGGFFERMTAMENGDGEVEGDKAKPKVAKPKVDVKADDKVVAQDEQDAAKAEQVMAYLTTHPANADRTRAYRQSKKPGVTYVPAMPATDWQALLSMCDDDPKVKDDDGGFPF